MNDLLDQYHEHKIDRVKLMRGLLDSRVVIVAKFKNATGASLMVQYFIMHGQPYTPIFTDLQTANHLLKGVPLAAGMKFMEIDMRGLLSILHGTELLVFTPGVKNMFQAHAHEFEKLK